MDLLKVLMGLLVCAGPPLIHGKMTNSTACHFLSSTQGASESAKPEYSERYKAMSELAKKQAEESEPKKEGE